MTEPSIPDLLGHALRLHQAGQIDAAEPLYREILAREPQHSDALQLLGMVAYQRGHFATAVPLVEQAIRLSPNIAIYHNNLGQALERLQRRQEATACYERALALDPNYAVAHNNLANMRDLDDRMQDAIVGYRRAIELQPDYAEAYTNLGNVYKEQGELDEAIACYRAAIERQPSPLLHDNLLFVLHYHEAYGPAELAREHRVWVQRYAEPLKARIRPHPHHRDPHRRLRIGYVSGDLREHAVARFLLPLFQQHHRREFEIVAYSDVARPDAVTARLRSSVDIWRDILFRPDHEVAEIIRQDAIDILVDLASHTANSRLLSFAEKPAPVQVTYLAYCSTTGMDTIDYRISDPYLDPPETDLRHYSEATVRLPETYWCYAAPDVATAHEPATPRDQADITFGCLNNFCKVTRPTLQVWGRLLRENPSAKLLLYARGGEHRNRVREMLAPFGVAPERVDFVAKQTLADYFATYGRIDIALDPFPFAGGTTTCDALWMGVPVVSLAGATAVSRGGLTLLSNIGLPELVARHPDDYIRIATALAHDRARLAQLRRELRPRMQRSPLMDSPRFTRHLEAAYRRMWQAWCARPA